MPEMLHDLLSDSLLTIETRPTERRRVALPEILARLSSGKPTEMAKLQAHQRHAWYAFLVQLGAIVAHRRGGDRLDPLTEDEWRRELLVLASDAGAAAWTLVVPDLSLPAFLQTPVPEGNLERLKKIAARPDDPALDILVTAKNHDVKQARMGRPEPEHWVYALVALQTMVRFTGRDNYGIARMNGGFGSRPAVAAAPSLDWSERFRRDVGVWLEARERLTGDAYPYHQAGKTLLWLEPWAGSRSLPMNACDPFFIEVSRRVRLTLRRERVVARVGTSSARFLNAGDLAGDTGDVWTPVRVKGEKTAALTVDASGFSYRRLADLLFGGDYPSKPALELRPEDGEAPLVLAEVLVGGQGETGGFHQRVIPVPPPARRLFATPGGRAALGELAQTRVVRAGQAQRDVLRPALYLLLAGGGEGEIRRDPRAQRWLAAFDRAVDGVFFQELWRDAPLDAGEQGRRWDRRLLALVRGELERAFDEAPVPQAQKPRAIARSGILLNRRARKHLEHAFDDPQTGEEVA